SSPRSTLDDRLPHHQPSTRPRRTELAARHNRYGVEPFEERPQTMPPAWLARPQMETEHGAAARNAMRRQDEARGMRLLGGAPQARPHVGSQRARDGGSQVEDDH